MLVGYARVSTQAQNHALPLDALRQAGCEKVFTETASSCARLCAARRLSRGLEAGSLGPVSQTAYRDG